MYISEQSLMECNRAVLCPTLFDPKDCNLPGSSVHDISQSMAFRKPTGVGCHFFLQGIFQTQELNPLFLNWQVDSSPLSHQGSP